MINLCKRDRTARLCPHTTGIGERKYIIYTKKYEKTLIYSTTVFRSVVSKFSETYTCSLTNTNSVFFAPTIQFEVSAPTVRILGIN